ncbi:hypothetical protein EDB80DRAFT_721522 [Ilyonectria destructans]|nr:hypothetical protein EDB80DRAFT_721522 [Ilyonectria destructans]
MLLLDIATRKLLHHGPATGWPAYAAVSHCREDTEITINDLHSLDTQDLKADSKRASFAWINRACSEARAFGVGKLWVDSLCIDRSSTAALSEAINSMFQIYQGSEVCLVHLSDIDSEKNPLDNPGHHIQHSRWTSRVWMLQELIASENLQFYDNQWKRVGNKKSLLSFLSRLLQVDRVVLENSEYLLQFPIGQRMCWASRLSAIRQEDVAYSLLGIFGVSMTILYGEGERAFIRLQEVILQDTDDATLFAWKSAGDEPYRGLFAHSPSEYKHFGAQSYRMPLRIQGRIQTSSAGILIDTFGYHDEGAEVILCLLGESKQQDGARGFGISLSKWKNCYVRSSPSVLINLDHLSKGRARRICITRDVSLRNSSIIAMQISPQLTKPNKRFGFIENGSEKGEAETETKIPDEPASTAHQIDPTNWIRPGTYTFAPDARSGTIAVSTTARNATVFLGTMVPMQKFRRGQISHGRIQEENTATTTSQSLSHEQGRYFKKRTRNVSHSADNLEFDEDMELYPDLAEEVLILDDNHPLMHLVEELTKFGLIHFSRWMSTPYNRGNERCSPPTRKRQKTQGFEEYTNVRLTTDSEDAGAVIINDPRMKGLFACPFRLRSPYIHQSCLREGAFSTFRNLLQHLLVAHRLPYYCPICGQIFAMAEVRDGHIRKMTCNLRTALEVEGVSENQIIQLLEGAGSLQSKEQQWSSVWNSIFRASEGPPMPYLASEVEGCIHWLRGYWLKYGQSVILDYLKSRKLQCEESHVNKQELTALNYKTLDRMIDEVLKNFFQLEDGNNNESGIGRLLETLQGM